MLENLQESLFKSEQILNPSPAFQADFHVNRIALQENVWHLLMSAICGANFSECIAKLERNGSWRRMYGDFYQAKMDGSSEEYLGTWMDEGVMYFGTAFQPQQLAQYFQENALRLLPAPIATDWKASYKDHKKLMKHIRSKDHQVRPAELLLACGVEKSKIPEEYERMMGFPIMWTDLSVSETP